MKPITVTITFAANEIPKGFRLTGEYRRPKIGEWFLGGQKTAIRSEIDYERLRFFLLEKLPQKKRKGRGKK